MERERELEGKIFSYLVGITKEREKKNETPRRKLLSRSCKQWKYKESLYYYLGLVNFFPQFIRF